MKRFTVLIVAAILSIPLITSSTAQAQSVPDSLRVMSTDVKSLDPIGYIDGNFAGIKIVWNKNGYMLNVFGISDSPQISEGTKAYFLIDDGEHILHVYSRSKKTKRGVYLEDTFIPISRSILAEAAAGQYVRIIINDSFFDLTEAL